MNYSFKSLQQCEQRQVGFADDLLKDQKHIASLIIRKIELNSSLIMQIKQIFIHQETMFSCRPNPVIKFYLTKNQISNMNHHKKQDILNLRHTNPEHMVEYPDHLSEHRKNIIIDFKKKVQELRSSKKKHSYECSAKKTLRVHTSRQTSAKSVAKESQRQYSSTERNEQLRQSNKRVNTINFSPIGLDERSKKLSMDCGMSAFQRSVLKRLKARQQIKLKKKLVSEEIDQRHSQQVQKVVDKKYSKGFKLFAQFHPQS